MIRRRVTLLVFLMVLFSSLFPLGSRSFGEDPLWLMLEKGRKAVREGELGEALTIFHSALGRAEEEGQLLPEADLWLGYIFEQEGEWRLAEEQYRKVLDQKGFLYIPEEAFTVLYRLAGIYENSSRYGSYEATLKEILALNRNEPGQQGIDPRVVAREEAMYRLFLRDGMDKLFTLYRDDNRKYQMAYQKLGVFSYRTGLYRESVRYLIQALITPVTNLVEQRRREEYKYQFTSMSTLLPPVLDDPDLAAYLRETSAAESLYYLGAALYAYGEIARSQEVWRLLILFPETEPYRRRALRQLTAPFVEPLLLPQD